MVKSVKFNNKSLEEIIEISSDDFIFRFKYDGDVIKISINKVIIKDFFDLTYFSKSKLESIIELLDNSIVLSEKEFYEKVQNQTSEQDILNQKLLFEKLKQIKNTVLDYLNAYPEIIKRINL